METPEQTSQRKQLNRGHITKVREEETSEQTTQRRQSGRLQKAKLREDEAPEKQHRGSS